MVVRIGSFVMSLLGVFFILHAQLYAFPIMQRRIWRGAFELALGMFLEGNAIILWFLAKGAILPEDAGCFSLLLLGFSIVSSIGFAVSMRGNNMVLRTLFRLAQDTSETESFSKNYMHILEQLHQKKRGRK